VLLCRPLANCMEKKFIKGSGKRNYSILFVFHFWVYWFTALFALPPLLLAVKTRTKLNYSTMLMQVLLFAKIVHNRFALCAVTISYSHTVNYIGTYWIKIMRYRFQCKLFLKKNLKYRALNFDYLILTRWSSIMSRLRRST
jgi:hypothetical protein